MIGVWLAAVAGAQDPGAQGFDAHGLQLSAFDGDARDPIAVDRPATMTQGRYWAAGLFEFADRTLVFRQTQPDGSTEDLKLLDNVVGLDLSAGAVVYDGVQVGFSWPLYLAYSSSGIGQGAAVGDLRLQALTSVLRPSEDDPVELGFGAYLDAPTGLETSFLGQAGVAGGLKSAVTCSLEKLTLGGDLGLHFNPKVDLDNLSGADDLRLGLAAGFLAAETTGIGLEMRLAAPLASNDHAGSATPAEALLTTRHKTDGGGFVTGALGTALSGGAGAANWRLLVGGGFGTPSGPPKDTDADGFIDKLDACVSEPESVNQYRDDDGCPDLLGTLAIRADYRGKRAVGAQLEANDGVNPPSKHLLGPGDWQILTPPGSAWTVSASLGPCLTGRGASSVSEGRTEVVIALEPTLQSGVSVDVSMADGRPVPNATFAWVPESTGCVPDGTTTVDAAGHVEQAVGVGSHTWTVNAPGYAVVQEALVAVAGQSMPIKVVLVPTRVNVTTGAIEILETVKFETGKAILKVESNGLLDEIAATLRSRPDILLVEIGGHTDDQGADAANVTLSQNRANAVRDYLVAKGITASRLTSMGYGEAKPIAPNRMESGRALNRRVEFQIVKRIPAGG